jgi:hypothetical protein
MKSWVHKISMKIIIQHVLHCFFFSLHSILKFNFNNIIHGSLYNKDFYKLQLNTK